MPSNGIVMMISLIMSAQVLTSSAAVLRGLLWVLVGPSVIANQ